IALQNPGENESCPVNQSPLTCVRGLNQCVCLTKRSAEGSSPSEQPCHALGLHPTGIPDRRSFGVLPLSCGICRSTMRIRFSPTPAVNSSRNTLSLLDRSNQAGIPSASTTTVEVFG